MKKIVGAIAAMAFFSLVAADQVYAQRAGIRWRSSGGWGPGTPYTRMYDPKTVETINGEVLKIDMITPRKGMSPGVHMTVKTDKQEIPVHLGPSFFVEYQDVKLAPKDKVEVKGSRITFDGKPAIIAMELRKGDEVLKLRDESGLPVWSGWRRR
ncbi:MAG: DNA-binding protein [Deltaproteobacteria bacterium]|nr:DNA-binding protein [Deltaproteobacteria bacterium]